MNTIGFPNLHIGPFEINPTALSLGSLHVQWYGIIIVCGMILGVLYAAYRLKDCGMTLDQLLDVVLVCIPCGIVGARVYYVLTTLDQFEYKTFYDVIAIWEGGIAIFGGIIGGLVGLLVVCRVRKYPTLCVLDAMAPGVLIGQIMGRWGNFMNGEAYGVTDSYDFLGHTFPISGQETGNPFIMTVNGIFAQPTFLYESVWNLLGFLLIHFLWKHRKYDGQMLLVYCMWYGFGRAIIEGMRGDSLYIGMFRISQLLACVIFVAAAVLLVVYAVKKKQGLKHISAK